MHVQKSKGGTWVDRYCWIGVSVFELTWYSFYYQYCVYCWYLPELVLIDSAMF